MIVKTGDTEIQVNDISVARINKSKSFPWRYSTEIQFSSDKDLTMKEKDIVSEAIEKFIGSDDIIEIQED